ncbi:hypothetical protein AB0P36_10960 [Streptomyces flavidovirens]|uniref:hypothetical protein n=1 Tax=Streptomyces flavidovirens TaxID=67298 RepID=UPI0034277682
MSDNWPTQEEMDRRQAERLALIKRCGPVPTRTRTAQEAKPPTEREQQLNAGLIFSDRDERQAAAEAEDRLRRRRADAEVAQRDHLWQSLRNGQGIDYADEWMGSTG